MLYNVNWDEERGNCQVLSDIADFLELKGENLFKELKQ